MKKMVANALVAVGTVCFLVGLLLLFQRHNPRRLAFANTELKNGPSVANVSKVRPIKLVIPNAGIDLSIFPAEIKAGSWETTDKGVSYLSSTPLPGERGNSVIYGHNFTNILGSLHQVRPGDNIEVFTVDGRKLNFRVMFVSIVTPDQTHILENSQDSRITIYTCTGFLDTKRLVVTALLQN